MNAKTISILAGIFLIAVGSFSAGMWTTYKNWWPWRTATDMRGLWHSYRATGRFLRDMTFVRRNAKAADGRYTVSDPAKLASGEILIARFDGETQRPVAELISGDGTVMHRWPIDQSRLVKGGHGAEFPHATTLLADGSLLINFDDARTLARINPCGDPVWVRSDMVFHHVISKGVGGYWVWGEPRWDSGHNQFLVRFDPETGKTLEQISLLDDVIPSMQQRGTVLGVPDDYKLQREAVIDVTDDIFHPNDIEELLPEMAPAFPMFTAGDLLISMRNLNLVAVIDRKSHQVKWAQYGPWRDQHDPDFEPDGTISVFSNNLKRNRSTIISINPATNVWRDLYLGTDLWFSSFIMGKQQLLPNGNRLIASAMEGRVIEVTPEGETVREFNNMIDENYNSVLNSAEFVPEGYLASAPQCAN